MYIWGKIAKRLLGEKRRNFRDKPNITVSITVKMELDYFPKNVSNSIASNETTFPAPLNILFVSVYFIISRKDLRKQLQTLHVTGSNTRISY